MPGHVSAVAAMLARAAPSWLVVLVIATTVLVPLLLYAVLGWALGCVSHAMARAGERRLLPPAFWAASPCWYSSHNGSTDRLLVRQRFRRP